MNRSLYCVGSCFLILLGFTVTLTTAGQATAQAIDFEDLSLQPESSYNGSDGAGGFFSGGAHFVNNYNTQYNSWLGWSYSNRTDGESPGYTNQYSAAPASGADGSANYGVAFLGAETTDWYSFAENAAKISLPVGYEPVSMQVANTTYAAKSMRYGDQFAKPFGGPSGTDPDFFKLSIVGLDADDEVVASVGYDLADFTFNDPALDFIREGWNTVDLSDLQGKEVVALGFWLESSDVGAYGMNTPAYFAMDDLALAKSPPTDPLLPADLNRDNTVSRGDLQMLLSGYGSDSLVGDVDRNGNVGLTDLAMLQRDFGKTTNEVGSTAAAVPEPTSLLTLVIGLTALFGSRRRRRLA